MTHVLRLPILSIIHSIITASSIHYHRFFTLRYDIKQCWTYGPQSGNDCYSK